MEYGDSSWTKRGHEDVVSFETSSKSYENQNGQLMSSTVCDTMDSQIFRNLNEELDCRAERDQESNSEERRQTSDSDKRQIPRWFMIIAVKENIVRIIRTLLKDLIHVVGLEINCLIGQQNAIFHIVPCQNY